MLQVEVKFDIHFLKIEKTNKNKVGNVKYARIFLIIQYRKK